MFPLEGDSFGCHDSVPEDTDAIREMQVYKT
jgi:hypothetical protein